MLKQGANLKIILFAHPRSGSNTLMKILNLHPKLNLLSQPFNKSRHEYAIDGRNYRKEIRTSKDLDRVLDEINSKYNGFKTFSFQLPESLNRYLLTKQEFLSLIKSR